MVVDDASSKFASLGSFRFVGECVLIVLVVLVPHRLIIPLNSPSCSFLFLLPPTSPSPASRPDRKTTTQHKDHCLHLLVSGYPQAYVEFFELTDGTLGDKPLRDDDELMLLLRSNLATCEDLVRENHMAEAVSKRNHLARIFRERGMLEHAKHHLVRAEQLATQSQNTTLIAQARRELGILFEQIGGCVSVSVSVCVRVSVCLCVCLCVKDGQTDRHKSTHKYMKLESFR